jgi:hypothetical protein
MFILSTNLLYPTCSTSLESSDNIKFSHRVSHSFFFAYEHTRHFKNQSFYRSCEICETGDSDTLPMYKENSMSLSSYNPKQSSTLPRYSSNLDYPSNWSVDDVIKWLNNISLQAYCENFRSIK